jgi:hypothetical protein
MTADPLKLRDLASWYRLMADRAGSLMIWEARLRTAEDLEAEAALIERAKQTHRPKKRVPRGDED